MKHILPTDPTPRISLAKQKGRENKTVKTSLNWGCPICPQYYHISDVLVKKWRNTIQNKIMRNKDLNLYLAEGPHTKNKAKEGEYPNKEKRNNNWHPRNAKAINAIIWSEVKISEIHKIQTGFEAYTCPCFEFPNFHAMLESGEHNRVS